MKVIIMLLSSLLLISTIYSQTITWSKVYGETDFSETAHNIHQTQNGDYILIGTSIIQSNVNVCLLKLNQYGDSVWTKTYYDTNFIDHSVNFDISPGFDSGFVFYKSKFIDWDNTPLLVIWTNSIGDSLFSKEYNLYYYPQSQFYMHVPKDIDRTSDSCFIIVGEARMGNYDGFVIKISATGDSIWADITWACPEQSYSSVVEGKDKSFLIGLEHYHINEKSVEKLDSLGNTVGVLCSLGGFVQDIEMLEDSNFVFVSRYSDPYSIVKITEDLDTIWTRSGIEYTDVAPCSDGGFVVTGSYNNDLFLTKYNTNGDSLWTVTYGGGGSDVGRCVEQTADGGFIICGYTTSYGTGSADFYIIKTDSLGYALGVEEEPDPEIVNNDDIVVENISQGSIRISFVMTQTDDLVLRLYDLSGREIESSYRVQTENNRTSIVVRNLNPGVYFFRIEGESKLHEGKFVVI